MDIYTHIHKCRHTHSHAHIHVLFLSNSFFHCRQAQREQNIPSLEISTSACQAAIRQKQHDYINHCKSAHFSPAQSPQHRTSLECTAPQFVCRPPMPAAGKSDHSVQHLTVTRCRKKNLLFKAVVCTRLFQAKQSCLASIFSLLLVFQALLAFSLPR